MLKQDLDGDKILASNVNSSFRNLAIDSWGCYPENIPDLRNLWQPSSKVCCLNLQQKTVRRSIWIPIRLIHCWCYPWSKQKYRTREHQVKPQKASKHLAKESSQANKPLTIDENAPKPSLVPSPFEIRTLKLAARYYASVRSVTYKPIKIQILWIWERVWKQWSCWRDTGDEVLEVQIKD